MNEPMTHAAASTPCAQCPWRESNRGRRHPDGWYTQRNLARLWAGLRRGERMSCHPTDPSNPVPEGARPVPEGTIVRECAGAQVLIQRELDRVGRALRRDGGTIADYRAENPKGLTLAGAHGHMAAHITFPGDLPITLMDLGQPDVGHRDLAPWVRGEEQHAEAS